MLWQIFSYRNPEFTSVAWSPDGGRIAAGGMDGCIWIFDAASGERVALLEGHARAVWSVAYRPDGKLLASGSSDHTVRLWEATSGHEIVVLNGHSDRVRSVSFSPDGKMLASGSDDRTLRLWDPEIMQQIRLLRGHTDQVSSVAFSRDSKVLASGSIDGTLRLWAAETGEETRVHKEEVGRLLTVAYGPNRNTGAFGSKDNTVRLWGSTTQQGIQKCVGHTGWVRSVAYNRDGLMLASGSDDGTVRLWDPTSSKQVRVCEGHRNKVLGVAFSPYGNVLASGSADNTIRLWDVASGKEIRAFEGYRDCVQSVALSPAENLIASASDGSRAQLSDAATGKVIRNFGECWSLIGSVAFSTDGKWLAAGLHDDAVQLWAVGDENETRVFKAHSRYITGVAFSKDGTALASGSGDGTVQLWDLRTGNWIQGLQGHDGPVSSVAFRPDGDVIASGSQDHTVRLWDLARGETIEILRGHTGGVFQLGWSPDGQFLVSSEEQGESILWRCSDWSIAAQWPAQTYRHWCAAIVESDGPPTVPAWLGVRALRHDEAETSKSPQVRFRCARVVLIGDGGAGKTSLAYRLQHNDYKKHSPTHGLQVWKLDAKTLYPGAHVPTGERREIFIWDLGGQEAYRILHQLFFPDTKLAVFLFVPRGQRDLEILEDWNHCLEAQTEDTTQISKLLVRAQIDRETLPDPPNLDQLIAQCGFSQPFRISSETGAGIDDLRQALYEKLDWISIVELAIFQQVRQWVAEAWTRGEVTLDYNDLQERARPVSGFTPERFAEAVRLVKEEGLAFDLTLESAGRLVVNPEPLERYAGSIVLEAMRGKSAPVVEYHWVMTTGTFQGIDERLPRDKELQILECAVQVLVERRVCLLVDRMLVFPQLFEERGAASPSAAETVRTEFAYDFTGPIQHVYANIAVSLALARRFGEARYWADRAEYRLPSGEFFGLSVQRGDRKRFGRGEIEIYFSPDSPEHLRQDFYQTIVSKLNENKVRLDERQRRTCESTGRLIPAGVFESWREQVISRGLCPMCQKHEIRLWSPLAMVKKAGREAGEMDRRINAAASSSLAEVRAAQAVTRSLGLIRILHLTDLHCLPGQDEVTLAEPLLTDLRKQEIQNVDFLVVSGDFSDRCQPEGFVTAKAFLRHLIEKRIIESPERLILVPGNHDQLQSDKANFEPSESPGSGWSMPSPVGGYYVRSAKYMDRFGHFYELYKDLTKGDYPVREEDQWQVLKPSDRKIQFLTLNSAWQTDVTQPDKGSLHPGAIARAIAKLDADRMTIAVWHHAPAGREDDTPIAKLADARVRLALLGHVHERRSNLVNPYYSAAGRMHIMGGGAYGTGAKDRPPGTPRMYNLIEVADDNSRFTITTRCRAEGDSHFDAFPAWPVPGDTNVKTAKLEVDLIH